VTGRATRQGFAQLFQDEERFWIAAAFLLCALALMKGLRAPNLWAATQAQISYQFGFAKRGLFGEWFARPLHLEIYRRFAAFSSIALAGLMTSLVWFVRWTGMAARISPIGIAVFASSYAITYLGNMIGYFDIILAALTIAVICVRRPLLRYALALPAIALGLLMHELFLLVFFPAMLVPFLLDAAQESDAGRARWMAIANNGLILVAVAITCAIALHPSLSAQQVLAERLAIAQRADFPLRGDFFDVLTRSTVDNVRIMIAYAHVQAWWIDLISSAVAVAPAIAFFLWLTRRILGDVGIPQIKQIYPTLVLASLAPLSMNLLGWDVGRWFALAQLTTFLVFGAVCLYTHGQRLSLSPAVQRMAIAIVALNLVSGEALLDGVSIRAYPYLSSFRHPF